MVFCALLFCVGLERRRPPGEGEERRRAVGGLRLELQLCRLIASVFLSHSFHVH